MFTSPKSTETWYNTSLNFQKYLSRDQNDNISIILDDIIIQQQFFLYFKFFLCLKLTEVFKSNELTFIRLTIMYL